MNKSFAFLLLLIIIAAATIMPCCLGLTPPPGTYKGNYSGELSGAPSITFSSPNNAFLYTVVDVPQHAGFFSTLGNSSVNIGFLYNFENLTLGLTANTFGAYTTQPTEGGTLLTELDSFEVLTLVSYKASWLEQPVVIYSENISNPNALATLAYNLSLADIPEGHQQIIVTANEEGYIWGVTSYWSFSASTSAVFNFNVLPLSVSFISPVEGQVFLFNRVPLVFNVNESPSWLGFSLDNLAITEIDGNTTLTGFADGTALTNGHYSLAIYAEDSFGNIGKSENINFTIAQPEPQPTHTFPTATVIAVSVVVVAVVGTGLVVLIYRRHRKTANLSKPNLFISRCKPSFNLLNSRNYTNKRSGQFYEKNLIRILIRVIL